MRKQKHTLLRSNTTCCTYTSPGVLRAEISFALYSRRDVSHPERRPPASEPPGGITSIMARVSGDFVESAPGTKHM